ncbi:MAG: DUF1566 domain-containing protein [Burkholderiales bacterium]|nr:DUF1566 domain-containing protein [Burkholderiales bacterium]
MNHCSILSALALCLGLSLASPGVYAVTCAANIAAASNPDSAYTDRGDGTVTHNPTGLVWKRCSEGQSWSGTTCTGIAPLSSWTQALTLAKTSFFAAQNDWRLPNLKELRSLVEECRFNPSINDTIFPNAPSSGFWSGSPRANDPYSAAAWGVSFGDGQSYGQVRDVYHGDLAVRLVRGGQSFDSLAASSVPSCTPNRNSHINRSRRYFNPDRKLHTRRYFLCLDRGHLR